MDNTKLDYSSIALIFDQLIDRTKKGTIKWEPIASDSIFQTSFPKHSIRLLARSVEPDYVDPESSESEVYFALQLYNSKGFLLEDITEHELTTNVEGKTFDFRELYNMVRRTALKVNQEIGATLAEIMKSDS